MRHDEHLSDLQLDQWRVQKRVDSDHLSRCEWCRSRLDQLNKVDESMRGELAIALAHVERLHPPQSSRRWPIRSLVASAAGALSLIVVVAVWRGSSDNGVRIKGSRHLELLQASSDQPLAELVVGEKARVRLSGASTARALVLRDVDGSFKLLWPLKQDPEVPRRGTGVELEFVAGEPPGKLVFVALFGPPLKSHAVELAEDCLKKHPVRLPIGVHAITLEVEITRRHDP